MLGIHEHDGDWRTCRARSGGRPGERVVSQLESVDAVALSDGDPPRWISPCLRPPPRLRRVREWHRASPAAVTACSSAGAMSLRSSDKPRPITLRLEERLRCQCGTGWAFDQSDCGTVELSALSAYRCCSMSPGRGACHLVGGSVGCAAWAGRPGRPLVLEGTAMAPPVGGRGRDDSAVERISVNSSPARLDSHRGRHLAMGGGGSRSAPRRPRGWTRIDPGR
jgi:hypothetical protein